MGPQSQKEEGFTGRLLLALAPSVFLEFLNFLKGIHTFLSLRTNFCGQPDILYQRWGRREKLPSFHIDLQLIPYLHLYFQLPPSNLPSLNPDPCGSNSLSTYPLHTHTHTSSLPWASSSLLPPSPCFLLSTYSTAHSASQNS